VQRFPDLTFQGTVNPEGTIVFPLLGTVPIQGLSLQEAQDKIQRDLDRFVVNPQVTLSLLAQRPVQVTVVGAIARPGFYNLGSPKVADAVINAGGSLPLADLQRIEVRRAFADGTLIRQEVDLYTPLANGEPLPPLRLEDGDVVMVPTLPDGVIFTGDRGRWAAAVAGNSRGVGSGEVGSGELGSGEEGNLGVGIGQGDPGQGDPDNTQRVYDDRLISTSTLAANLPLKIRVLSYAAGAGGTLTLPAGSTFRDALNGIPLDSANLRRIALIRYDPASGTAVQSTVNGRKALMGDPTQDPPLRDNDVIVIGRALIPKISYLLNQFTQPFRDTLGFLLFFDSLSNNAQNLFQPTGSGD